MARKAAKAAKPKDVVTHTMSVERDVDYTIPGLIALVAIVLVTALFFAQPSVAERASFGSGTVGGKAIAAPTAAQPQTPGTCTAEAICEGSRLIRRSDRCTTSISYCQNGCERTSTGAQCL